MLALFGIAAAPFVALPACGGDEDASGSSSGTTVADASLDAPPRQPPFRPAASCEVVIEAPALMTSPHVPEGTAITWNSNPPSSGPHYPIWAHFQEYASPVQRGYLVHSIEHGAVLLLYKCDLAADAGGCPAIVEQLRQIRDAAQTDAKCDPSTRVRIILAPDPDLDVPVAAAAWGFTYKAACVDKPTLEAFVRDNYAKGPEDFCNAGQSF